MVNTSKKNWRIAVVGAGFFSQFHLKAWSEIDGVDIVGLCDSAPDRAQQLGERFGVSAVFPNLAQMLDTCSPDLVDVVTPPASHSDVLCELLDRKLSVICQKPFGLSYAQALGFTQSAERSNTPLIVHENFRFMPWFREARRLIDQHFFGELHGISFRLRPGDGQGPKAYLDRQPYFQTMPRLLVAETAIHFIDAFRYLMGEVTAVYAHLRRSNPAIRAEDVGLITFEFQSGATGLFDGNRLNDHVATNPRRTLGEMWLEGSTGVMRLDGDGRLWWKPHHAEEKEHLYDDHKSDSSFGAGACRALQRQVINNFNHQLPQENTARQYLRNLLIQEAVYTSHATGQRISIDSFESDYAAALGESPRGFIPANSNQEKETS